MPKPAKIPPSIVHVAISCPENSSTMYTMAMMKHSSEETRRCRSVILLFCIGIAPNSRPEARQIMPSTTAMAMDSGEVINIPFVT